MSGRAPCRPLSHSAGQMVRWSAVFGRRSRGLPAGRSARRLATLAGLTATGTAAAATAAATAALTAAARGTTGRAGRLSGGGSRRGTGRCLPVGGGCARGGARGRLTALPLTRVAVVRGGRRRVAGAARHQEEGYGRQQGDGGDETCTLHERQLQEDEGVREPHRINAACPPPGFALCHPCANGKAITNAPSASAPRRLSPTAWPSPAAVTGRPGGRRCPRPRRPPPGNPRRDCGW